MMENRTVNGDEAVALGMAGEVVDDADLPARLAAYCQQLCEWSPITLRLLKRGMVKSLETTDMEQQLRYELGNIRIPSAAKTPRRPAQPSKSATGVPGEVGKPSSRLPRSAAQTRASGHFIQTFSSEEPEHLAPDRRRFAPRPG